MGARLTHLFVQPVRKGFGRALALVNFRSVRMAGREELERGVSVDFKTVGKFSVLVSIHFRNHHILPKRDAAN